MLKLNNKKIGNRNNEDKYSTNEIILVEKIKKDELKKNLCFETMNKAKSLKEASTNISCTNSHSICHAT